MKRVPPRLFTSVLLASLSALGAPAAVAQDTANGFLVKHEVMVSAPPAAVYATLIEHVGQWWNPGHTYSGNSENLSIDARPGGCFCESFPDGGGVEHLRVVHVVPGEMLRLSGALGPLQAFGVTGSLTWKLSGAPGGTSVELTYAVGGFIEGGLDRIAPAVSGVLGEQLQRLKLFAETGEPTRGSGR